MKTPAEIAVLLEPTYGPDPSKVAADELVLLIREVVWRLGYNPDVLPEDLWRKVVGAAGSSEATDLTTFATELQEALR